ncbi:MAG: hypothetical protein KAR42_15630 [candidate division Zixibacteria bacterium]|nr:hypothetical protein [candidate division Zixibacteria bacterium]
MSDYEGMPMITTEALEEVKYRIKSAIDGIAGQMCTSTKFESGEKHGLQQALDIIEEGES